jgi:glyoxylase-like metal-dependent hydrolase (beta-lactamase superfamily II)
MTQWIITALDVGTSQVEKSVGTYLTDSGKIIQIPNIVFLIEEINGAQKVIVDTGFESAERTLAVHHQKVWRNEDQRLEKLLQDKKVDPMEIQTVILTHLHYDHCGNNGLFPNARFFVQRKELQYAFVPLPGAETAYFSPLIGEKPSFWGSRFEIVEGDYEICDGIRLIATPGHTPGSQAILVSTMKEVYCIAGDNVFFYENIGKNIPVGSLFSRVDWFASIGRIRRMASNIIPSHDPLVFKNKPAVFP